VNSEGTQISPGRPWLSPGTRLNGIYEIDQPIGVGGMGEIYKGHLVETNDPVAIKMMLPEMSANEAALTLFRKEASALHYIQHDAVVRYYVFTVEPQLRRPYLAMEFVDGRTLTDLLDQGPLSFEAALSLLHRVASGLQAAHERGVIHRDVSPDNIILPNDSVAHAKIIDFGIARTTQHGTVIGSGFAGKYSYVSPEQLGLFGGDVSAKSDIYSLGLVLVQALTGKAIDMGGTQVEIIEKRRQVPDLGAIDVRIRALLEQMLEPDPAQRPESMAALAAWSPELTSSARRGRAPAAPTPGPISDIGIQKKSPAVPWKYAAAALVLIALLGAVGGAVSFVAFRSVKPGATPGLAEKGFSSTSPAETEAPEKSGETSAAGRIKSYIAQYDGGNCFFLASIGVSERAAVLEGFGSSVEPFKAFDAAFKRQIGFEANIGVRQVTEQQCPAISFLSQLRGNNARIPHLDIEQEDLKSGSVLNGIVDSYGERQIALLLVSDSGTVQNVSNLLKPGMDSKNFALGLKRAEGVTGREPQLLIAIATPSPIGALQSGEPAKADQFFPKVLREAASSGTPISAAARYFSLEGGG
jgi:serine/threonine protein kinase